MSTAQIVNAQTENVRISDKQYVSKQWDNTRGLPVNTVFKVIKDETGYLWAATEEGLVRFDGVNFRNYNQDNIPELVSTMFYDLKTSSDGGIWAANANMIVHAKNNQIQVYDARAQVEGTWITSISEIHNGDVWAGTNDGDMLVLKDGNIEILSGWEEYKKDAVMTIETISNGVLIGTQSGLYKYIRATGAIEEIPDYTGLEVRSVAEASNGSLWVGTRSRGIFHHMDGEIIEFNESNGLANNRVNALQLTDDGSLWAGFGYGGVQMITKDEIISLREIEFGLHEVNDIYLTESGNVWLSVTGYGIIQMIPADVKVLREIDGLSNDITLAIYQDKNGVIWTGTAGAGMNRIENGEITNITPDYGLENGVVLGIYGVDDFIYLGTGSGLYRYNPETDLVDRFFTTDDGLASNIVQAIYQDSRGQVWVTSRSGGIHKLHNHQEIERVDVPDRFQSAEFISIFEDRNRNIWFSTTSTGILKLDGNDNLTGYSLHHGPSSEMVLSMYEDPEGSIWAGTNEGLLVLKDGDFKLFNRSNGLQFNGIFRMIEDDHGYLWTSGNFGIQRISINDLLALKNDESGNMRIPVRLFDTSDGMANHEANGGVFPAGWKMESGEIWFPTMQGIAIINPVALLESEGNVEIYIESLRYGGNEFTVSDEIVIPPGINNLEINYGSFDFKKPHTINYSYRISALSDEWQSTGNRTTAYLTSLNPGNYIFEIKAEQFGVESDIASISFSVKPFFYQSIWFRSLVLVGLFLAGFFIRAFYAKHKTGILLKRKVDEKTRQLSVRNNELELALRDIEKQNKVLKEVAWVQSHELRGPLSRLLGFTEVFNNYDSYKTIKKDKAEIAHEIEKAAKDLDDIVRRLNREIEEAEQLNSHN
ncbi:MAG: two-component regulator propeller domain-containing protein [Gracilimonas sp.]